MTLVRKIIEPSRTHKWNAFCTRCHVVCVCVAYYVNSVCIYYKINGNSFFCLVILFCCFESVENVEIEFTLTHTRVYKPYSFFICVEYIYIQNCVMPRPKSKRRSGVIWLENSRLAEKTSLAQRLLVWLLKTRVSNRSWKMST